MSYADIRGWFSFADVYDMALANSKDNDTLVEVGVAYGKSLAYLARKAIDTGSNCRIIGVDPWIDAEWDKWDDPNLLAKPAGGAYEAFLSEMRTHAPEELARVGVYRMLSTAAAKRIAGWGASICAAKGECDMPLSFVWIDAVHDKPSVLADIKAWLPLIRPGGMIGGHDLTPSFPGVEEGVCEYFGSGGYARVGASQDSWLVRL